MEAEFKKKPRLPTFGHSAYSKIYGVRCTPKKDEALRQDLKCFDLFLREHSRYTNAQKISQCLCSGSVQRERESRQRIQRIKRREPARSVRAMPWRCAAQAGRNTDPLISFSIYHNRIQIRGATSSSHAMQQGTGQTLFSSIDKTRSSLSSSVFIKKFYMQTSKEFSRLWNRSLWCRRTVFTQ